MQELTIALCQGRWRGDRERTQAAYAALVAEAAAAGAELICLPEFTLSPYFPATRDASGYQWAEALSSGPSGRAFARWSSEHHVHILGSIFERGSCSDTHWDTAVLYNPEGRLSHFTRKVHIPAGEGYHESDFFGGARAFPVHDIGALRLAAPTCYDQWFPELARIYALRGAELIVYPTAIGSEPNAPQFDSRDAWQLVMRGHAVANGIFIAACNRWGQERVTFYGSSFICDPRGQLLAEAPRDEDAVIIAQLQPDTLTEYRALFPLLHQRRPEVYGALLAENAAADAPEWLSEAPKGAGP
ncbi:MAG: N-carbamoylputrescine amidase [Anaerolineaceae bacterium]|nr:N-carbamoylputrescine amidase [Anaerolineaceae bacterium]